MKTIKKGFIHPSAALTIPGRQVATYARPEGRPEVGDVVYGEITRIAQHSSLENVSGRIHAIHNGSRAIFVFGNRYAPDHYEGIVPPDYTEEVSLLARSGVIGKLKTKNSFMKDPTTVRILGRVFDPNGRPLNTRAFPAFIPRSTEKKSPRARMVLVCGTSMNAGKSSAAAACCWALSTLGYNVRASKVTGTASLKDILHMNDAGAAPYADFTYLGYPSTYLLPDEDVFHIFDTLDLKYANNPRNFWVVELADGIAQRETAMLLSSPRVASRIFRLIFCATDAFSAIGGLGVLRERFGLVPDAVSGICSSSPLHLRELAEFTSIPVFDSINTDLHQLTALLLGKRPG